VGGHPHGLPGLYHRSRLPNDGVDPLAAGTRSQELLRRQPPPFPDHTPFSISPLGLVQLVDCASGAHQTIANAAIGGLETDQKCSGVFWSHASREAPEVLPATVRPSGYASRGYFGPSKSPERILLRSASVIHFTCGLRHYQKSSPGVHSASLSQVHNGLEQRPRKGVSRRAQRLVELWPDARGAFARSSPSV